MSLKDGPYGSLPSDEVVSLGVVGSIQLGLVSQIKFLIKNGLLEKERKIKITG